MLGGKHQAGARGYEHSLSPGSVSQFSTASRYLKIAILSIFEQRPPYGGVGSLKVVKRALKAKITSREKLQGDFLVPLCQPCSLARLLKRNPKDRYSLPRYF